ncbi:MULTISPECIES: hypothetical protein [Cryobacterium]|uniref:ArsR family transcriptional regulator n=1 Tax=Cryobacterium breve TaxID=1259258 RepID=A0ABY2J1H3_9MICO|nr:MULTISPECIES: hypothetical protein [Cryobacterium]TFC96810.1 hypothetical protein E3T20_02070 [Cryobacterium sp. TmT3-12]TFC97394.1 hypothetical protein E3O65_11435 [Cryobacterium breve]
MVTTTQNDAHHAALASEPRRRALALLTESAVPLDVGTVATALGLHITTARFHLEHLETAGLVLRHIARAGRRGRPHVLFSAIAAPLPTETAQQQLTEALAAVIAEDDDGGRARAVRAGERWSAQYAAVADAVIPAEPGAGKPGPREQATDGSATRVPVPVAPATQAFGTDTPAADVVPPLLRVLTEIGFAPELQAGKGSIVLTGCPFRAEAKENPAVVCSVHLGLMKGLARSLGHDGDDIRLRPFVQPHLCIVELPSDWTDAPETIPG